jgi:hypothetical protein
MAAYGKPPIDNEVAQRIREQTTKNQLDHLRNKVADLEQKVHEGDKRSLKQEQELQRARRECAIDMMKLVQLIEGDKIKETPEVQDIIARYTELVIEDTAPPDEVRNPLLMMPTVVPTRTK